MHVKTRNDDINDTNMEMNKNLCRRLGNLSLPVLLSVVLLASCRDEIETGAYTGPYIRFSVSEGSEWHSTRAAGGPAEKAVPRDSVQPLHGGDGNTPLYLHTLYTDSIASPSSDICPDTAVLTRATPVKRRLSTNRSAYRHRLIRVPGVRPRTGRITCTMSRSRKHRAGPPPIIGRLSREA